jgi:hypothetical protein
MATTMDCPRLHACESVRDVAWQNLMPFVSRSAASRAMSALDGEHIDAPQDLKDSVQDMRLFSRTPGDPYVRAYMVAREYEKKEKQQESLWTASFDRVESTRAKQIESLDGDRHNMADMLSNASLAAERPSPASTRPVTVWTRPGTVSAGVHVQEALGLRTTYGSSAGGGHHMYSRTNMRELIQCLPNPAVTLTDFAEYERLQTSYDDSLDPTRLSAGRDFLGARRIIDPKMTRASTALGNVGEPKWLPFNLGREESNRLRARPSPLTGRKIADFALSASLDPSALTGSQVDTRGPGSLLRSERRLQAALQGTLRSKVSGIQFSNDDAKASKLLDSLLPTYKATTLRGGGLF